MNCLLVTESANANWGKSTSPHATNHYTTTETWDTCSLNSLLRNLPWASAFWVREDTNVAVLKYPWAWNN